MIKIINIYRVFWMVLLITIPACKKDHSNKQPLTSITYDTLIVLQNGGPAVRISFATNTFIDLSFSSTIDEGRCPNCLTLGQAQCPYKSWANANFKVKNQNGDSTILQGSFKSCYAENDTAAGSINGAQEFSPFNTYNIWPIALNPYPTDTNSLHYSMTLLIQYPAKH